MSSTHAKIEEIVQSDRIVLFMKGSRGFPQCGFSATVVQILDGLLPDYKTVNVLADPEIRQGVKDYSSWPTVPQLYVDGEFVGGCDIIRAMHTAGDLAKTLGASTEPVAPPAVTVSDSAKQALSEALGDEGDRVHVSIDANFAHNLGVGSEEPGSISVEANGIVLSFDPASARRANGLSIDFLEQDGTEGFKLENPNAPKG